MNIKKALYDIPINMMANRSINIAEFYRTAVIKINSSNRSNVHSFIKNKSENSTINDDVSI